MTTISTAMIAVIRLPSPATSRWKRLGRSWTAWTAAATLPTSVAMPVSLTTNRPLPPTTTVAR